jgi:peptidoglycan hydrolase CwlO-like protein
MNKKHLLKTVAVLAIAGLWTACSSNQMNDSDQKEIEQIESLESELDQATEGLDAEIEDMNHDVDSLLEGI